MKKNILIFFIVFAVSCSAKNSSSNNESEGYPLPQPQDPINCKWLESEKFTPSKTCPPFKNPVIKHCSVIASGKLIEKTITLYDDCNNGAGYEFQMYLCSENIVVTNEEMTKTGNCKLLNDSSVPSEAPQ